MMHNTKSRRGCKNNLCGYYDTFVKKRGVDGVCLWDCFERLLSTGQKSSSPVSVNEYKKEIELIEIYVNSICNVDRSYNFFEGEKRTEYSMHGCV